MSALFVCIITTSAVGLWHVARLEGYVAGLKRGEQQRREAVERHREWVVGHWPADYPQPGLGAEQRGSQ